MEWLRALPSVEELDTEIERGLLMMRFTRCSIQWLATELAVHAPRISTP